MKFTMTTRLIASVLCGGALMAPLTSFAEVIGVPSDAQAQAAILTAEKTAESLNAKVCIAVVDGSGNLKAFEKMEGAAPGCVDSAIDKARAAAVYHTATWNFMDRVNHGEPALTTLPGMVPLGGGVPAEVNGVWLGAVGDAGSLNVNEVKIATAGGQTLAGK